MHTRKLEKFQEKRIAKNTSENCNYVTKVFDNTFIVAQREKVIEICNFYYLLKFLIIYVYIFL